METNEDKLLKSFFSQNKPEIADNGFTQKVMRRLPENEQITGWIILMFTALGCLITFALVDVPEVISEIFTFLLGVPIYYLLGGFMLIPIVTLVVMIAYRREYNLA